MIKAPKISIGLPVYNGERYLRGAIESLLDQTYRDFELIISDNASTDATEDICREFVVKDNRIRYFRNETNIGAAPNHNRVFELANGEFFKWAAHDDLYPREMLQRCLEAFEKAPPSVSLVYTQFKEIDAAGNCVAIKSDRVEKRDPRPHARLAQLLLNIGYYTSTYGLMRSNVLRKTRLEASFPYSDRVFLAEMAMLGELWEIATPLLCLRHHAGRSTLANATSEAIRNWYDPKEAKKASLMPLQARADMEIVCSVFQLPLSWSDRMLCLVVALAMPCWLRLREYSFPLRKKLGLAPSVWRMKHNAPESAG